MTQLHIATDHTAPLALWHRGHWPWPPKTRDLRPCVPSSRELYRRERMTARTALVAIVALAAMLETGTPARAQAPTDDELRRLSDAYIQAWAKADPKALAGLYTTEGLRVGPEGRVAVGRKAIEQAMLETLTGPYRGTKNRAWSRVRRHARGRTSTLPKVRSKSPAACPARRPDPRPIHEHAGAPQRTMADRGTGDDGSAKAGETIAVVGC